MSTAIADLIEGFRSHPTAATMTALVDSVRAEGMGDTAIAHLALAMGQSGVLLSQPKGQPTADLASTGGPTSLSTLLGPLYLRDLGYLVPKLGVPGRPLEEWMS